MIRTLIGLAEDEPATALCVARMAAAVAAGRSLRNEDVLRMSLDNFNSRYAPKLGCGEAVYHRVCTALELLRLRPCLMKEAHVDWQGDPILVEAVTFAILRDCSEWHWEEPSIARILLENITHTGRLYAVDCLPLICDPDRYAALIREFIDTLRGSDQRLASRAEDWLFLCLVQNRFEDPALLGAVCDALFANTVSNWQVTRFADILSGPNGEEFDRYIDISFVESCRRGEPRFGFAEGALYLHKALADAEKPLSVAEHFCLEATEPEDRLPWLSAMSLTLWCGLLDGPTPEPTYRASVELCELLRTLLTEPDGAGYAIAASCAEDLILSGRIDPSVLDEAVGIAAMASLDKPRAQKWAEHILALLSHSLLSDSRLKAACRTRFFEESAPPHYQQDAALSFGCCLALGCWNHEEVLDAFAWLCRYYERSLRSVDHYQLTRLEHLMHRLIPDGRYFPVRSSVSDPLLFQELSPEAVARQQQRLLRLAAPDAPEQVLTEPKDVLETLLYLDSIFDVVSENPEQYRCLLEKQAFSLQKPGSFLVTRWFEYLCRMGLGPQAVDFYRQHKAILDLPMCWYPVHLTGKLRNIVSYLHFWSFPSRLCAGIRCSLRCQRIEVLQAFANSEFRHIVDNEVFLNKAIHPFADALLPEVSALFDGRHGLAARAAAHKHQFPKNRTKKQKLDHGRDIYYGEFYDDPSVLRYTLIAKPGLKDRILALYPENLISETEV